ncbi:TPA: DUF1642 domain-containing protein [Streptococcus suis]|nr:DUF1642 domain-containing protein [Streptococcus suis]HEM5100188.1 DUF1642 domain-containing protein [Streptococcus suis]HEM5114904.1 DUF1642 domain-containing protein [Streptococcus suis]HEO8613745.1 DUF1642 domain-containing protein [Streptococcus suis]
MKRNDFYEVNGCTDFIPVTINEAFADGVDVTVNSITHTFRMAVKQVYQFQKQHESQTVVVPKFIADSIEYCKNEEGYGLLRAMDYCDEYNDTGEWLERPENQETFACAWLFGFEIEQEKLYTVEIPDPNSAGIVTFLHKKEEKVLIGNYFCSDEIPQDAWKKDPSTHLTESEIKEDFEWAWNAGFAKEVK